MKIYQDILTARQTGQKLLAVLVDPEKIATNRIDSFVKKVNESFATHIFVGGSTDENAQIERVVIEIKKTYDFTCYFISGQFKSGDI